MTRELRILHCLRAPVGGLFRHVCDLVEEQTARGHKVGVICDSTTGDAAAAPRLRQLEAIASLGVKQFPMSRQPGPLDLLAAMRVVRAARACGAQIIHGHGAKGGAYARLAGSWINWRRPVAGIFYTPHGGSLHYAPTSIQGRMFLGMERWLARHSSGIIFESAYSERLYREKVAEPPCEVRVIPNGLKPQEFYETATSATAADFLYVGELRHLKGCDVLLEALGAIAKERKVTAFVVGSGPDEGAFRKLAKRFGIVQAVEFPGAMPAAQTFARGRCLVVPSRAESFPYVVLEAAAARLPMIATNVGGIPEITADAGMILPEGGDAVALRREMEAFLDDPSPFLQRSARLQGLVAKRFTVAGMTKAIMAFYATALPAEDDARAA
ncbi:MAG: glycosyltransferase family 4 protein [Pseudomonadota bacterium]|nr:glycosyltransferase family 4 protein [Pseudomonadota bacterium]